MQISIFLTSFFSSTSAGTPRSPACFCMNANAASAPRGTDVPVSTSMGLVSSKMDFSVFAFFKCDSMATRKISRQKTFRCKERLKVKDEFGQLRYLQDIYIYQNTKDLTFVAVWIQSPRSIQVGTKCGSFTCMAGILGEMVRSNLEPHFARSPGNDWDKKGCSDRLELTARPAISSVVGRVVEEWDALAR